MKSICLTCALLLRPTVRQLIGEWIRPFTPDHLCWGAHQ